MSDRNSVALYLRLPADLHQWVADQSLRSRRSMNAVVVEAIDLLKAARAERHARDGHAAAIELAISLARVPKGTEIAWRPNKNGYRTEILARKPSETDYTVLAIVHNDEVVFADNVAGAAQSGDCQ